MFALVTACCMGGCVLRLVVTRVSGESLDSTTANERLAFVLSPVCIPQGASGVSLDAGYFNAFVSFQCGESEFKKWATHRNWELERRNYKDPEQLEVFESCFADFHGNEGDGYVFSNSSHRGGYNVYYELDSGRAWLCYSHH
jgi:hypothetical protein